MQTNVYLCWLLAVSLFWTALLICFTWIVDPYGVSPVRVTIPRINEHKPKRVDIDRIIKPYEVWRYQPKTVFLGTSRIHQSIDPSVLENTRFAPAYNASIPASTLGENAAHLEQYFALNKNIKYVFVELFFSNFRFPENEYEKKSVSNFLTNAVSLHYSISALASSVETIMVNLSQGKDGARVIGGGAMDSPNSALCESIV
jgi:hypothetical protein